MQSYVKFFPKDLTCRGFKYKLGLNIDTNTFDPTPTCGADGLYYTDIANMAEYLSYGPILGFVTIPDNVPIVKFEDGTKYKSPEIFITKFIKFKDWITGYTLDLFEKSLIKNETLRSLTMENPSEGVQLAAVEKNGDYIGCIKDPSDEVQLAAVNEDGTSIEFIKDPSEAVQLAAVTQDGWSIEFIKDPSEAVQLAAVKQDGNSIQYIKDPCGSVQLAAVNEYGKSIRFIEDPSDEVKLAAVKKYGDSIQFINDPTETVQLAAVKQDETSIRHIENPSDVVKLASVNKKWVVHYANKGSK